MTTTKSYETLELIVNEHNPFLVDFIELIPEPVTLTPAVLDIAYGKSTNPPPVLADMPTGAGWWAVSRGRAPMFSRTECRGPVDRRHNITTFRKRWRGVGPAWDSIPARCEAAEYQSRPLRTFANPLTNRQETNP